MRILLTALSMFLLTQFAFSQACPPRPSAAPKLVNNDICIGQPISVQNLSNTNGNDLYYIWDWGDGSKSDTLQNTTSPVHIYERPISDMCSQPNGGYVYKIKLTAQNRDGGCLSHSTTTDAYAYFSPIADFIAPREVCIDNAEVAFANTTCPLNTPGTKVMWNFGDAASGTSDTSSQVHPRHVFSAIGRYTVNLTVTSFCNTSVKTMDIIVRDAPSANGSFTLPTSTVCAPYELTIANNSQNATGSTWSVYPASGWEFANGTDATSANPVVRFNQNGEYTLSLQINSLCGTRDWTSNQRIVVKSAPKVAMDTLVGSCVPFDLKPIGQVVNDGGLPPQYLWTISGGSKSSATTLDPGNITFPIKGTFPIKFKATNSCGEDSVTRFLAVRDKIEVAFTNIKDTLCNSETAVQMKALPAGGVWSGAAISGAGVFNPSVAGVGSYSLTYTVTFGACSDRRDTLVRVFGTAVNGGPIQAACGNEAVPMVLNGAAPLGGKWTGTGVTDSINGIFNPGASGVGKFTLTYSYQESASKCLSFATKEVTVHQPPTAVIDSFPAFCINSGKTFKHSSIGSVAYKWQFGDGDSTNIENPSHAYLNSGTYRTKLMVTSAENCKDTTTRALVVSAPPAADYTESVNVGCTPLTVVFNNNRPDSNTVYTWNFGRGRVVTNTNPGVIIFDNTSDKDTIYHVVMKAETPGCVASFDSSQLTVYTKPRANFAVDLGSGCSPLKVSFSNVSTGSPRSYYWNFANGITSNAEQPVSQTYYTDTTYRDYNIQLVATNTCGNDTMSRKVTVTPSTVKAFFGIDRTEGCSPLTVNISNASSYGSKVSFDLGDGTVTNTDNFNYTFTRPGTFKIVQKATGGGCGQDSVERIVNVWATPSVEFTYSQFNACKDRRVQFKQKTSPNVSVWWTFGDGAESGTHDPLHDYGRSGTFPVKLAIEDITHGCKNADSTVLDVRSPLKFKIDSVKHSGCYGINTGAIVIRRGDVTGGIPTYEFAINDPTFSDLNKSGIFSNLKGRDHYVVYVRDRVGCVDTSSVDIKGFPPLGLDAGKDREIDLGDSTQTFVTTNAYKPLDLKWTPASSVSCDTCENVWLKPIETTTYSVSAKGPEGCTEKARVTVRVASNRKVFIPNVFTPNSDGNNDYFYPFTARNVNKINYMRIFNRWGEMVFETKDFQPNEQQSGWDGKHKGVNLAPDVYVYVLEVELKNGITEVYKGDVTLMK
jgi:gliding motility-associated-like protein